MIILRLFSKRDFGHHGQMLDVIMADAAWVIFGTWPTINMSSRATAPLDPRSPGCLLCLCEQSWLGAFKLLGHCFFFF